jgi:hypothetical protein
LVVEQIESTFSAVLMRKTSRRLSVWAKQCAGNAMDCGASAGTLHFKMNGPRAETSQSWIPNTRQADEMCEITLPSVSSAYFSRRQNGLPGLMAPATRFNHQAPASAGLMVVFLRQKRRR